MKKMKNEDVPLYCTMFRGKLIIGIGIDTLAFAGEKRTNIHVTNALGFAKDVQFELLNEDEEGANMLTNLFDTAMEKAVENGSIYVKEVESMCSFLLALSLPIESDTTKGLI